MSPSPPSTGITMPQNGPAKGTGVAPLLYWLTVICGLAGLTVVRFDEPHQIVSLWFGSVVGIAIGQIFALLRVRIWAILAVTFGAMWFVGPVLYVAIAGLFGGGEASQTALLALLPAAVCGYASLTERGGLLAFWFPVMLWMLVILDGPNPGTVSPSAALPFAIALGALFVAFLRARESRRVALWRTYGNKRLATELDRTLLRESPSRGLSQFAWTCFVGAGALVLAAWIAPLLWQKEQARHERTLVLPQYAPKPTDVRSGLPCCHARPERERVREYLSLGHGYDRHQTSDDPRCVSCETRVESESNDWSYGGTPGAGLSGTGGTDPWDSVIYSAAAPTGTYGSGSTYGTGYGSAGNDGASSSESSYSDGSYTTGDVDPVPVPVRGTPPSHVPPAVQPGTHLPGVEPPKPEASRPATASAVPSVATPAAPLPKPQAAAPPSSGPLPWRSLLAVGPIGLVLLLLMRAVRRQLTMRHLGRPFWPEPIDQRISNHWQRMLVGLRDAGIRPSLSEREQPQAFARRVGIEGMDACATILDRVRHGVRVDVDDLMTMNVAATSVYETSRKRAGVAGRLAGAVRWPLV